MKIGSVLTSSRKWLVALPVLAMSVAGCGSQSATAGKDVASTASGDGTSRTAPPSKRTTPGKPTGGSAKPDEAVKNFVTQVLTENYAELCMSNAPVLPPDQDPAVFCAQPAMHKSMGSLHDAWAKPGVKLPPEGEVTVDVPVKKKAKKVEVPDTAITLDGRSLRELELIGSSGDTSSFSLSLGVVKKDGRWYVESWNIEV
ncbi:hypothetical protein [Saccharopolyspora sp. CA-218241]|uniref:hypothetical protein n=1 Tax=Saccharopolyspora sp. CA-218241 TaxID=3240027 RepID=UPI003D977559